jgi:hypothetical protein
VSKTNFNESKRKISRTSNQKLKCTHCNKVGHSVEKCFELVGYPTWMRSKSGQGKKIESNNSVSNNCDSSTTASSSSLTPEQVARLLSLLNEKNSDSHSSNNLAGSVPHLFSSNVFAKPVFCFN